MKCETSGHEEDKSVVKIEVKFLKSWQMSI